MDLPATEIIEPSSCDFVSPEYNLGQHTAALFIIFGVSLIGTVIPIAFRRTCSKSTTAKSLAYLKMFGASILVSAAIIHMLGQATVLLSNPCLPVAFTNYGSWAGGFTLLGMLSSNLLQISVAKRTMLEGEPSVKSDHSPPELVRHTFKITSPNKSQFTRPTELKYTNMAGLMLKICNSVSFLPLFLNTLLTKKSKFASTFRRALAS